MKKLLLLGFIMSAPLAAQTNAQVEARYSRNYAQCMDSPDGASTYGMLNCIHKEYERQDATLNTSYRKAMARLPNAKQAKLRADQRAWIKQRDAKAQTEADEWDGGTGASVAYNSALLRETIRRTIWLERYR